MPFAARRCNLHLRVSLFVVSRIGTGHQIDQAERRFVMKRVLLRCQIVWVLAVSMSYAQSVVAQGNSGNRNVCSNAALQGSFGYTQIGTLLPAGVPPPFAGPYAEVGRQTFDGKGNTDATGAISANGNIIKVTIQGTYTVNPDCTGSMTLAVSPLGATAHYDLVIDNDGAGLRAICVDTGAVVSLVYSRQ
jgi:hypothetical protein